jgi:hypothetical protein
MNTLKATLVSVRPHEKVLLHWKQHWTWGSWSLLPLLLQLLRVIRLPVLQMRLSCLLWGAEVAEVVVAAGCCSALSLVPALVLKYTLKASVVSVRPHKKVLLHWKQHWSWCSLPLLLQLLRVIRLPVQQMRLSCLLFGAEVAKVLAAAGCCVAFSHVPAMVWIHTLESSLVSV